MVRLLQHGRLSEHENAEDGSRGVQQAISNLEIATHLLHAAIMAFDSIEDIENRNALVALLAEIEGKIENASRVLSRPLEKD